MRGESGPAGRDPPPPPPDPSLPTLHDRVVLLGVRLRPLALMLEWADGGSLDDCLDAGTLNATERVLAWLGPRQGGVRMDRSGAQRGSGRRPGLDQLHQLR